MSEEPMVNPEPQGEGSGRRRLIIGVVVGVLLFGCCCCTSLAAAWVYGDTVVQWLQAL